MARYIDADKLAEYITTNYCKNCDIYDGEKCNACPMNDALNYIETFQTADVVPKSEVTCAIIDELLKALQSEVDAEEKLELNAWKESDTVGYHIHRYAEEKLDTFKIALSLMRADLKKKSRDARNDRLPEM